MLIVMFLISSYGNRYWLSCTRNTKYDIYDTGKNHSDDCKAVLLLQQDIFKLSLQIYAEIGKVKLKSFGLSSNLGSPG